MPDSETQPYGAADVLRLFYAVLVPAELQGPLAELQQRLRRAGGRVSWVAPANLHFTLQFLGEVPAGLVPALQQVGQAVGEQCAPVAAELRGVGAFPSAGRPRVLWVATRETALTLTRLATTLRQALTGGGFAPDEAKPFASHCTLGRLKEPASGGLVAALAREAGFVAGRLDAAEFHLMRSELSRSGPTYTKLASFALRHPGRADAEATHTGGAASGN